MSSRDEPVVFGNLRIQAMTPKNSKPIDITIPVCVVQTFLCPECPNVHFQVDAGPPVVPPGMTIRVGLQLVPEEAEKLSQMLLFPEALRQEDAEEGLS